MPTSKAFSKAIVRATESTCLEDDPAKSGWLADAHHMLEPLIEVRNSASELLKEQPLEVHQSAFKKSCQELKKAMMTAKNRSEFKKAAAIMKTMSSKPREAWVRMQNLEAGHNAHHKINKAFNFAKDGIKATNDKENLKIASNHFENF
jgi:hypothetical protein